MGGKCRTDSILACARSQVGIWCVDQELDRGQSPGTAAAAAGKYANMIRVENTGQKVSFTRSRFQPRAISVPSSACYIGGGQVTLLMCGDWAGDVSSAGNSGGMAETTNRKAINIRYPKKRQFTLYISEQHLGFMLI